jgi:uncharacterized protein
MWGIPAAALVLIALTLLGASRFIDPAPPKVLRMATGQPDGAYSEFAKRYEKFLARERIKLEIQFSNGSQENLARLADPNSKVDVAFVQSGVASASNIGTARLVALGGLYYEALWVFYRGESDIEQLRELKGKRLAIGPQGSGTRLLALQLLDASGFKDGATPLSEQTGKDAARALAAGLVDAIFLIGAPTAPAVQSLLHEPGVRLMSFAHAEAYTRMFAFLSRVSLPRGLIDLERDIPPRDTELLAATATLVAREDTHPALVNLLLHAASEIHGTAGWFQKAGEFPSRKGLDIELSDDAARYYKRGGPPFFQRYLPFHIAVAVERALVLALPLLAVLVPLVRYVPPIYTWRARRRVYRWYRDLRRIERELLAGSAGAQKLTGYRRELDLLEQQASHVRVPLSYNNELYWLREHIQFVRNEVDHKISAGTGS